MSHTHRSHVSLSLLTHTICLSTARHASDRCCRIVFDCIFDRLGHHVKNVVHDRGTQLEIVMRLDALFVTVSQYLYCSGLQTDKQASYPT